MMGPDLRERERGEAGDVVDVDEVADELYGLLPGEFVAARDAAVRAARAEGQRDVASGIAALRKPTTTAWLVNLLVRDDPDLADHLRDLGEGLRGAEQSLAGAELTALDKQRRQLVAGLVKTVRQLARDAGQRVTQSSADEVSQTLLAALADPDAADEVLSGRLTQARAHVGFGASRGRSHLGLVPPLDEETPRDTGVARRTAPAGGSKAGDRAREARDVREAREAERERKAQERREKAAAALSQARSEHAAALEAEREADLALSRSRATRGERAALVESLTAELEQLTRRLEGARADEEEAARETSELEHRHTRDAKALRWAAKDLDAAQAAVDRV